MKHSYSFYAGKWFAAFSLLFSGFQSWSQCSPDVTAPNISCPSDMNVNSGSGSCGATVSFAAPSAIDNCGGIQSTTFSYTGAMQTFTVPAGITSITIEAWGAQGQGGNGGLGGYVKGDMTVTPGQVLNVFVGGQNGYNGGGLGYAAVPKNGGGASDVRAGGTGVNDRVIVAGGGGAGGPTDVGNHQGGHGGGGTVSSNYAGGGGGAGYGGSGGIGGATGGSGNNSCHSGGAGGGGFTSGGNGSCNTCYTGSCGQNGSLGQGGNGDTWENGICYNSYAGTAGGGGGYYGGGGTSVGNCGSGAGGGGSSWTGTLTSNVLTGGVKSGNGQVVISFSGSVLPATLVMGMPSGSSFPIGTTIQQFQAVDGSGNSASCSFTITVIDGGAPVPALASLSAITDCSSATPTTPAANDACEGVVNGTPNVSFPITTPGTTVVTWTYDDGNGNTSTQTQNVIIDDGTPVPDAVSLPDYSDCISATPTAPTATDPCDGSITGTPDVTFPITAVGTTVVTWTFDDGNGHTSTQTQNVIVTTIDLSTTVSAITTITANNAAATYQWIDCDAGFVAIPGETGQSFVATTDGNYAVIVDEGGCVDTSACVTILGAGINSNQLGNVKLYPSPTRGDYTLELDQAYSQVMIKITDASGRIYQQYSVSGTSKITNTFTGSPGIYFVQVHADGKTQILKLVIE